MSGIKYYALRDDEELPEEFVVIRNVDGEPKFIASYINTNYLDYENGVLLKMHERNDVLRAENAKLRELARQMYPYAKAHLQLGVTLGCNDTLSYDWELQMVEMGIEVPE